MVSRVLDHRPNNIAERLPAHDWSSRQWPGELIRSVRPDESNGIGVRGFEHLASGREGIDGLQRLRVLFEIQIETLRPGNALDEPIESLRRVRHLLGHGHHSFAGAELRVRFLENPGGTVEELLTHG